MEAVRETTGGLFPAHVYLLDGTQLVAYIRVGTQDPVYFGKPIKGFDRRRRQFESVPTDPFTITKDSNEITVQGSGGQTYQVNTAAGTCTCPGFRFRGRCRHLAEHG
jgi:hypothetical protein